MVVVSVVVLLLLQFLFICFFLIDIFCNSSSSSLVSSSSSLFSFIDIDFLDLLFERFSVNFFLLPAESHLCNRFHGHKNSSKLFELRLFVLLFDNFV